MVTLAAGGGLDGVYDGRLSAHLNWVELLAITVNHFTRCFRETNQEQHDMPMHSVATPQ
jgi:hypothetical protein